MMMCSTTQKIEQYEVKISSVRGKFEMTTTVSQVAKGVLLSVPNPGSAEKINKYPYLEGVVMDDEDNKPELPIHLILGAGEYSRIKTDTKPRIGKAGEPIAELTTLGLAHDVSWQGSKCKQCLSYQNLVRRLPTVMQSRRLGPSG